MDFVEFIGMLIKLGNKQTKICIQNKNGERLVPTIYKEEGKIIIKVSNEVCYE